jgi:hypothetical protein
MSEFGLNTRYVASLHDRTVYKPCFINLFRITLKMGAPGSFTFLYSPAELCDVTHRIRF